MGNNSNVEDIEIFCKRFIDSYVVADIRKLIEINEMHKTSYPYLALAFSGVDFFGALEKGINAPTGERFRWFIKEWMGKVKPLYSNDYLTRLIYNSCRNGIFHNAILKNSFNVSSYLYPKTKHLHLLMDSGLIFFHSIQFAEDFLEAQNHYRTHILRSNDTEEIRRLSSNLSEMVEKNLSENVTDTQQLIRELKLKDHIVKEKMQPVNYNTNTTSSTTTTVESSRITMTVPPSSEE